MEQKVPVSDGISNMRVGDVLGIRLASFSVSTEKKKNSGKVMATINVGREHMHKLSSLMEGVDMT